MYLQIHIIDIKLILLSILQIYASKNKSKNQLDTQQDNLTGNDVKYLITNKKLLKR